jgi:hypothetical protein
MKRLIYILLASAPVASHAQSPPSTNWADAKNWKIYYVTKHGGYTYSLDTLQTLKQVSLNADTIRQFLKTATEIPVERQPVFMGYYVASCQLLNGTSIKIEISQYGAFFYDDRQKKYYQLADGLQRDWLAYLTDKWRQLQDSASE